MRKRTLVVRLTVVSSLALLLASSTAQAWGMIGHRYITARAIDLLPSELKAFFDKNRTEVVLRSTDPDLWRDAGWEDGPNHFVDFGMPELGPYPFDALPHDYDRALEKFGINTMKRIGLLPWRFEEIFGNLRRAFEGVHRGAYATTDVVLFSAVAAHYIQDAHQPLHASNNYDGQLTGNYGIHARFESELIERFQSRLTVTPAPPKPIRDPREAAFAVLLDSYKLVDPILEADRRAVAGKDVYDDDYFEKLFATIKPILERRLADSITATAALIIGAWEAAGRPAIQVKQVRPLEKVKK